MDNYFYATDQKTIEYKSKKSKKKGEERKQLNNNNKTHIIKFISGACGFDLLGRCNKEKSKVAK